MTRRDEELREAQVGGNEPSAGPVKIFDYDPRWPEQFSVEAAAVRAVLGDRVLHLEHVGSTSVPRLPAKPIIDMLLVVVDSADEPAYVPEMEAAGYTLRIRERNWHEHRMFGGRRVAINLHVFSKGCPEIGRMLAFRNWLRSHERDRELYARTKRELARKTWKYVQHYADAKTGVVEEILKGVPLRLGSRRSP